MSANIIIKRYAGADINRQLSPIVIKRGFISGTFSALVALLAGRAGGQTINGGTSSGENLTLSSTAHATKGNIVIGSNVTVDDEGKLTFSTGVNAGAFFGDGDTGFYETSDDNLVVVIAGDNDWKFTASSFGGSVSTRPAFRNEGASATNPNILPINSDTDTGIGSAGDNLLSLIAGGVEGARVTPTDFITAGTINSVSIQGLPKTRDDHGTISTGSEEISAAFTHHTLTTGGSHAWTFAAFTEAKPEASLKLVVSGGTPTITLPGTATISSDSAQTLSALAAGTYLVEIVSFDGGSNYEVIVAQVS